MLILKGKNGKGPVFNDIYNSKKSACFSYTQTPCYLPGYWIDRNTYSIDEFRDYLEDYFKDKQYDGYILVYTDLLLEEIEKFSWVDDLGGKVIIACF